MGYWFATQRDVNDDSLTQAVDATGASFRGDKMAAGKATEAGNRTSSLRMLKPSSLPERRGVEL